MDGKTVKSCNPEIILVKSSYCFDDLDDNQLLIKESEAEERRDAALRVASDEENLRVAINTELIRRHQSFRKAIT